MAENAGSGVREEVTISCFALELSDGGHAYLKSTWETTSFSIVVLDGVHAWSRTVSAKEVVSIATSWQIDVGEFMNSAQSHLCRQHPTSEYSISAEKDVDVMQLSFTIDDLLEGEEGKETLNFDLRLTRMSDAGAVVREMLDHLLNAKGKLEARLADAESQSQKKLAPREPEPSITLSLARPSATPGRQSSLVEPRLLDFTEFSRSEGTRSVCTLTPTRAGTATAPRPLEPVSYFSRERVRNNDLTLRAREAYVGFDLPLSPSIIRVLNNLSAAGRSGPGEDDRGVKITEMRSPARREEQSERSYMVETNPVSIDLSNPGRQSLFGSKAHEEDASRRTTTTVFEGARPKDVAMNWSAFSEKKNLPEHQTLEKSGSNAAEPGTVNKLAECEPKEGSDEEPTSRVTLEDAHLNTSDSGLRAKAEKPCGQRSSEDRNIEDQKLVRNEAAEETRSLESLWTKDIIGGLSSKSDKKSVVKDTPEYAPQRSGRKRTAEDRDGDFSGRTLGTVKQEVELDPDFEEPTCDSGSQRQRRNGNEVVDLEEVYPEEIAGEYKKRDTIQAPEAPPGFARNTIADLLKKMPVAAGEGRGRGRGRGRPGRPGRQPPVEDSPREKRLRRRLSRSDRSPSEEGRVLDPEDTNVDNFAVPDPDYYNFDKERTEDLIFPNQIWAVYDEKDGFPRVWARIDKVSRQPEFEVSITWLTPHKPSAEADGWLETSGYSVSCGKFEHGSEAVLDSINMFSHRMDFEWLARDVVTIYPKKGDVWALYRSGMIKCAAATKRPRFRVVHVLEDVEPEKRPVFSVLERIRGFRTVYKANYEPGSVAYNYLVLFSHRVPAYQLQGNEGPMAATLKGCWDVDPAGLPSIEGEL